MTIANGADAAAYLVPDEERSRADAQPLPVLVLLDLALPGINGLDLLETIRRSHSAEDLPVVVLSGSKESADIDRAFEIGANSYLVKPVAFSALIDTLENLSLARALLPASAMDRR